LIGVINDYSSLRRSYLSGCDICLKNDYLNEIIKENNWEMCSDTYEGAYLRGWITLLLITSGKNGKIGFPILKRLIPVNGNSESEFADNLAVNTIT
jgi:hypothetical protein